MENSITSAAADLTGITLTRATLFPGVDHCGIISNGMEVASLLLLTGGLVSLFSYQPARDPHNAAKAIGRVVVEHTVTNPDLHPAAEILPEVLAFESEHGAEARLDGLVFATHGATHRIQQPTVRLGETAVNLLTTVRTVMPVAWALLSGASPGDAIATEIGLILVSGHDPVTHTPEERDGRSIPTHEVAITALVPLPAETMPTCVGR